MNNSILVINSGSSSIKFSLISMPGKEVLLSGLAEKLGTSGACLTLASPMQSKTTDLAGGGHEAGMQAIFSALATEDLSSRLMAVGHRVVHGGEYFRSATLINEDVLAAIKKCVPFAPLHNPANLAGIAAARLAFPGLPQVAVFDTAFHQSLEPHAYRYAVPAAWYTEFGARRYGFHGTSHRFVSLEAARLLNLPLADTAFITAHLGNGASATAVLGGRSVDTSMGFTPLEGLVMGTRSGDVDPGLLPYIAERLKIDIGEVVSQLNKKSGLLGLSSLSEDMRTLQAAAEEGHPGARLALDVFVFRLAKYIAALTVSLPHVDALIFTGGIGENAAAVREKLLHRIGILGYRVHAAANATAVRGHSGLISAEGSIPVLVINTNEELMIALDTAAILHNNDSTSL